MAKKKLQYYYAVGRRKTAVAKVFFQQVKGEIIINRKPLRDFFREEFLKKVVLSPLVLLNLQDRNSIQITVKGGGKVAQAEAIRLGIARALVKLDPRYRKTLKKAGFLKRDPRMKERKKPGLKRARRAPQWQKR